MNLSEREKLRRLLESDGLAPCVWAEAQRLHDEVVGGRLAQLSTPKRVWAESLIRAHRLEGGLQLGAPRTQARRRSRRTWYRPSLQGFRPNRAQLLCTARGSTLSRTNDSPAFCHQSVAAPSLLARSERHRGSSLLPSVLARRVAPPNR